MSKNTQFNLTLTVNDKEVKNSIGAVGRELGKLSGKAREAAGTDQWEAAIRKQEEARKQYREIKGAQEAYRREVLKTIDAEEYHQRNLEDFGESFEGMMSSLMSGDLIGFQEGMAGVQAGIMGATKAAWAFIATPLGAALAAFTALVASAKVIWDYNAALGEMNKELRALGIGAEQMDNVRSKVEAVAETYDKEFSEIARKAKGLSETFGISMSEALDQISRGLADGGKMNSEFMDSLGEYDVFFADAGYSAQQFIDVVNQGFELGIYSDKLPDAIKEAGISLKEQTTATRDALVNAFGATFADDILSKIDKGEMTVREGLEAIAAQAEKTGLTQQQQAQLTADIFRGAGEDAGGAMKVLEAISKSAQRELDATAQAELELTAANERLNEVQSQLFGIAGFGELWINIKTVSVKAISAILEQLQLLKVMGSVVATEVTNYFIGMANRTVLTVQALVETAAPALKALGADVDNIQKSLQSLKLEEVNFVPKIAPPQKEETPKGEAPDPGLIAQQEAERKKREAEEKAAAEALKLREQRSKEAAAAEKKRLEEIDALQADYEKRKQDRLADSAVKEAELERNRAVKKAEALGATQALLDQIRAEHQIKIDEEKAKEEEEELARMREFEAKKLELENELRLARAESEVERQEIQKEIDLEKAEAEHEKKLAQFEQEMELLQLNEQEKAQVVQALEEAKQNTILEIQRKYTDEKIKDEERLKAAKERIWNESLDLAIGLAGEETKIGQMLLLVKQLNATREMAIELGLFKSKTSLKVAEATADISAGTAKTAAAAPFPANIPLILGFAAQVSGIISTIRNIGKAKQGIKTHGFAKGGFTDLFGQGYTDETGHEVAGVVHKNEYVVPEFMRKEPEVPQILEYLETKRKKKLGLYAAGGDVTETDVLDKPSSSGNSRVEELLEMLIEVTGENRDILFGYEAELRRQKMQEKLKKIQDRSKIKK